MLPFELTKDTPYLALSGELWSVFYEYLYRNWSCYKGFLLYTYKIYHCMMILMYVSWVTNVNIRVEQGRVTLGSITTIGRQLDETRVFSVDNRQITQL